MLLLILTTRLKRWWFYHRNKQSIIAEPSINHSIAILMLTDSRLLANAGAYQRRMQLLELWSPSWAEHINAVQQAIIAVTKNDVFTPRYKSRKYNTNIDEYLVGMHDVPLDLDDVKTKLLPLYQELQQVLSPPNAVTNLDYYKRVFSYLIEDSLALTEALLNATVTHAQ